MTCLFRWLCVVVLATLLWLPATGCGSALSREQEISLGEESSPKFIQESGGPIPDPQIQRYVTAVGEKLLAQVPAEERRDLPWEFHTLDSEVLNAFALPGGKVFITRGLLARLDSEAQMAGILGHEMGHVIAQHIGEQIRRQQVGQVLTGVAGAVGESQGVPVAGTGAQVIGAGILLKFSRNQELEADRLGMEYMYRAGYKPAQMRKVMRILEDAGAGRGLEMISTHPHPQSRLDQANELLEAQYADTRRNPRYTDNAEQYQANVLAPLRQLPPPKHRAEE